MKTKTESDNPFWAGGPKELNRRSEEKEMDKIGKLNSFLQKINLWFVAPVIREIDQRLFMKRKR